jgi:hydrophobe/amphiphile efflux-1 (HAE1) family protein
MQIANVSIDRPVFTTMVALGAMVLGVLGLSRLGLNLFPDVTFPVVAISTVYPGAGPSEIEEQVTRPIEDAVSTVNGVDKVRSFSRDSVSVVVVMFKLDADETQANIDVRDRVQQIKASLPDDVDDPVIRKFDPSAAPIMQLAVEAPNLTPIEARRLVDDTIRPALESVEGVGSIEVGGGAEREIQVDLDQTKLQAIGLSIASVSQLLRAESLDLPGGRLTMNGREYSVKAAGRFKDVADVENVVLQSRPDGTQIRVKDVGTVVDGQAEVRSLRRVNGKPAVVFSVMKQSGANTVAVTDGVMKAIEKLQPRLGNGVKVVLMEEQAKYIRDNINKLRSHLVVGGMLAILVIFFFMLDVRSTLISAVSLPTSVIATFFVIWQLGFSLNLMSMLALTLAIGLLIDDSVVVRENIFRHMEMGEDRVTAARKGTAEIALAVLATTLTIVAVFVPVAFMEGLIGRFFRQFGLTLTAAVLVSLVVSFTIDPMLSARVAKNIEHDHHEKMKAHRFYGPMIRMFEGMDDFYKATLRWVLQNRAKVMSAAAALFFGSIGLVQFMGSEFVPRGDQGKFRITFEAPAGIALAESERLAARAEEIVRKEVPEVTDIITTVGIDRDASRFELFILTTPKAKRPHMPMNQIMEIAREKVSVIPGVTYNLGVPDLASNGAPQTPVQLIIAGPDLAVLEQLAARTLELVKKTPGTRDVSTSLKPGSPEQRFVVNRAKAADRGVNFAQAAMALRYAIEGDVVGTIPDRGDDIAVRVRLKDAGFSSIEELKQIVVGARPGPTGQVQLVRLDEIVDVVEVATPASINRSNRQRSVTIQANLSNRSLGEVVADINKGIADLHAPEGYSFKFEGEAENMADTLKNMMIALALAVVFIYLILASQFESFVHPFTIMLALPLAVIGALAALFLTGVPIGMSAMIGIILLMGLVTKNGILLVDYTNQVREHTGLPAHEALLEAAPKRLRPILMTSAAIVLGELPTALSTAEGSEFNTPMAIGVIGGVITSTILTLVVVPVAYTWIDKLSIKKYHQSTTTPPSTPASFSTPAE